MAALLPFFSSRQEQVYLVGGYLRDWLLGEISLDMDFVVVGDALSFAKVLADEKGYSFFVLDKAQGTSRVVVKEKEAVRTVDFAACRGKTITDDLLLRDFTINALALDIQAFIKKGKASFPEDLIDPTEGWVDLNKRIVKVISDAAFMDDPVRLLRVFRFSCSLDFAIAPHTLKLIKDFSQLISRPAGERIEEELVNMLSLPRSAKVFNLLKKHQLAEEIFEELAPARGVTQDRYHHLDVWEHSFFALECVEELLEELSRYFPDATRLIEDHLEQELQTGVSRKMGLKLGTLLHDIGKPEARFVDEEGRIRFFEHSKIGAELAERALRRLRFAEKTVRMVSTLVREHLRPGFLAQEGRVSERAIGRLLREAGDELVEVVLLSLADRMAMKGEASTKEDFDRHLAMCRRLIKEYFHLRKVEKELPPLITGDDLMEALHLKAGPIIGILLTEVRKAQLERQITTREEALNLARELIG